MRTIFLLSMVAATGCDSDSAVKVFNAAPEATITSHEDGASVKEATDILFLGAGSDPDHSLEDLEGSWQSGATLLCDWAPLESDGVSQCTVTATVLLTEITFLVRDPTDSVSSANISLTPTPDADPSVEITAPVYDVDSDEGLPFFWGDEPVELVGVVSDEEDQPDELAVEWSSSLEDEIEESAADSSGTTRASAYLSEGIHTITLTVTDSAGNYNSDTLDIQVGPDNPAGAPNVMITSPAIVDGERPFYYGDQPIEFEGMVTDDVDAPDDLTITWSSDTDGELVSTTPDSDGKTRVTTTLTQGLHTITLAATDSDGKVGGDDINIEVGPNNTPPTCNLLTPEDGEIGYLGDLIVFGGTVEDPDIAVDTLTVEWKDGDTVIGTSIPSSSGNVSLALTELSVGAHVISMTVADEMGATCTDNVVYEVVEPPEENRPPAVSIGSSAVDGVVTEGAVVLFTASVSDPEDGPTDLNLQWTSDRLVDPLNTDSADSTGAAGFATSTLPVGTHTITLTVTDSEGLFASAMLLLQVQAVSEEENTAPSVSISSPADVSDVTVGDIVLFAATVGDAETAISDLEIDWNSNLDGELEGGLVDDSGYVAFTTDALSVGTHTITAAVTDDEGMTATAVVVITVAEPAPESESPTTENTAPSVTVMNPLDRSEATLGDTVLFAATVEDLEDDLSDLSVTWTSDIDGDLVGGTIDPSGYVYFIDTGLSLGTHTIVVTVTDTDGLTGNAVTILNVVEAEVAEEEEDTPNTAPEVTLLNPTDGRTVRPDETVLFAARISDAEQDVADLDVTWSSSLGDAIEGGTVDDSGYVHLFRDGLTVGTHIISVTVSDGELEGNAMAVLYVANETTDAVDDDESLDTGMETVLENTPPTVSITAPTSGSVTAEGDTVLFSATVNDAEDWPEDLSVKWTSSIDGIVDSSDADSSGYVGFTSSTLSTGTHTITILVTDTEGRTASEMLVLNITAEDEGDASTDTGGDASEEEEEEEDFLEPGDDLPPELEGGTYAGCDAFDTDNLVIFGAIDAALFCACGFDEADNVKINASGESDIDLSCLDRVDGNLEIEMTGANNIDLSNLESVDDNINIHNNYETESIDLGNLQTVGSGLSLSNNQDLEAVVLSSLTTVEGQLYLSSNSSLADFGAPVLTTIEGTLQVSSNNTLEDISFNKLAVIEGQLRFEYNSQVEMLSLPELIELSGQLYLYSNDTLESISLPKLSEIGSSLELQNNYQLEDLDFSSLTHINGSLNMYSLNNLSTMDLPALQEINGSLSVYSLNSLSTMQLPLLQEINGSFSMTNMSKVESLSAPELTDLSGSLTLRDNTDLSTVDLSKLLCIDDFTIVNNNMSPEDLHALLLQLSCDDGGSEVIFRSADATTLCAAGDIVVDDLYIYAIDPEMLDLSCIIDITGTLEIEFSDSPIINLSRAVGIGDSINIHDNYDLEEIWLDALVSTDESFSVTNNNSLSVLDLDSLEEVGGQLYFSSNGALETLYSPKLVLVKGTLQLYSNNQLELVDLPNLYEIEGQFRFEYNSQVEHLLVPDLEQLGGQLYVYNNDKLDSIDLTNLQSIGSSMEIQNNYQLESIKLDRLAVINGSFNVYSSGQLSALTLPELVEINGSFTLNSNNQISTLNLPELLEVNGSFSINNNTQIQSVAAPKLSDLSGSLTIRDNGDLETVDLSSLSCLDDFTIVGNNLTIDSHHALLISLTCGSDGSLIIFRATDADDFCATGASVVDNLYISPIDEDPVDLSCLSEITGQVEMEYAKSVSVDLQNVLSVGKSINIHDNYEVEHVDFFNLIEVGEGISISNNNELQSLDVTNLGVVEGQIYFSSNSQFDSFSAPSLTLIEGTLQLYSNNQLEEVQLANLTEIEGQIRLEYNNNLETLSMPNLTEVSGQLYVYNNDKLERISLNSLQEIGSSLEIQNNYQLEEMELSSLQTINGSFNVYSINELESLSLDALQEVNGSFNLTNCNKITALYAPNLDEIAGSITIRDNSDLSTINLDSLTCVSDYTLAGNDMDEDDERDLKLHIISGC